jgi:hypothetical protein
MEMSSKVELMAQLDPVMIEHLNRFQKGTSSHTTLATKYRMPDTLATKSRMNSLICCEQQGHFNYGE